MDGNDNTNAIDWSSGVAVDNVLDVDIEVANHDVDVVEVGVVDVVLAHKKFAQYFLMT
jgi:hypothetical protein